MPDPIFRLICPPSALAGAPAGWAPEMLHDGEVALLVDDGGLPAIDALAHELDLLTVRVVRAEPDQTAQERTVMTYASSLATVWIAASFGEIARNWAIKRGPMTLLVEADGILPEEERRRVERFVALLGRQAE